MIACLLLSLSLLRPIWAAVPQDQNPMDLSPEIRQFLDKKVDRSLPQMERLQALVSAVFRSNELSFTYAPATRTVIETYTQHSGNCLSFTFMFISTARYLGLDARFREVEIAPVWTKAGDFVNLSQHVNAAVFIGGQAYAIDVFPAVNRIEIGGQVVPDERGLAHFYNNRGVDELTKGNIETGESYLQEAVQADPTTVSVRINFGAAKTRSGELREAEGYLRRALELDPRSQAAMSNLAGVCQLTGSVKEALRYQAKIKEFREKNPYHHYDLGMQAFEVGRYEEATEHYRRALKLKSTEHNFYFALARAYGMLGQKAEAMNNLQLAEKYASDAANKQRYAEKLDLLKGVQPHF
jgi:Flp pilus assembly protein TadD